jgi:oxidase EvaA
VSSRSFGEEVAAYRTYLGGEAEAAMGPLRIEAHVETRRDWSPLHSLDDIRDWFERCRSGCLMSVEDIPLSDCRGWALDPESGFVRHESGDFFYVQGLRVSTQGLREVQSGWDQPMMTQVGFDGGILGMLRKRFDGVPMYLVEAKAEPGNYQLIQMSPTLQATFANINQAHKGRRPHFVDYFTGGVEGARILYDQWLSEDGGRLMNKRNRGMLVEVADDHDVQLPTENFRWMSLWQIKACLQENAWVNPHIRGIIAHI